MGRWGCLLSLGVLLVSMAMLSAARRMATSGNTSPGVGKRVKASVNVSMLVFADLESDLTAERLLQPAIEMAVSDKRVTFPHFFFNVTMKSVSCDAITAPFSQVDQYYRDTLHVVIGPACAFALAPVARFAPFLNVPVISSGIGGEFEEQRHSTYRLLTRILNPNVVELSSFFYKLLYANNWRKFAIYYDRDGPTGQYRNLCFQIMNVINTDRKLYAEKYGTREVSTPMSFSAANANHSNYFRRTVRANYSIVVMCADKETIREIMIVASDLGFIDKGEYVFINIDLFRSKKDNFRPWYKANDTNVRNDRARRAFESLMTITMRQPDSEEYHNFSQEVKARAAKESGASFSNVSHGDKDDEVNSFVGAFHDAVLLYALALNESLAAGDSIKDGLAITHRMWNRTFRGITGNVSIDANGDRNADYSLLDLRENGNFEVVANYFGTTKKYEPVDGVPIRWPNSIGPPPDTPVCGFDGSNCPKNDPFPEYAIVVIVMGSLSIIVSIAAVFIYRHYKLEAELSAMTWRIKWEEIDFDYHRSRKRAQQQNAKRDKNKKTNDNATQEKEKKTKTSKDGNVSTKKMQSAETRSIAESEGSTDTFVQQRQMFTRTGYYKGALVALKSIHKAKIDVNKPLLMEFKRIKDLSCDHIVRFIGACIDPPHLCIVTEYCPKGSLQDVLENEQINLDWTFKFSLMQDIVRGMVYIHSNIGPHGNLKSPNCVVDSRFVLKITDFGLHALRGCDPSVMSDRYQYYKRKLWTAPELLRQQNPPPEGSVKGDVFSFAIVCQEIIYRSGVWFVEGADLNPEQIIRAVKEVQKPPFRPTLDAKAAENPDLINIVRLCWSEDPNDRPDFAHIKLLFRKLNRGGDSSNILDNLLARMEQYANNLEDLVEQRTADYLEQKKRAEELLYMMLPRSVANQLIRGEPVVAESYEKVSIYFSDICGFTDLCARSAAIDVVNLLNDLYSMFDFIIESFDVYKVETIGDAYMCVSGLPVRNGNLHAREIARMSLALLQAVQSFKIRHEPYEKLMLRIGMHSGPVCTGVVGLKMPRYCLFGDTVNTASRMESNGAPLRIHLSSTTKEILDTFGTFKMESRGQLEIKGKGIMNTWWLLSEDEKAAAFNVQVDAQQTYHTQGNILSLKNRDKPINTHNEYGQMAHFARSMSTCAPPDLTKLGIAPVQFAISGVGQPNANANASASAGSDLNASPGGISLSTSPTRTYSVGKEQYAPRNLPIGDRQVAKNTSATGKTLAQVHQFSLFEQDEAPNVNVDFGHRLRASPDMLTVGAHEKRSVAWAVNGDESENESRMPLISGSFNHGRFDETKKTNSASATA